MKSSRKAPSCMSESSFTVVLFATAHVLVTLRFDLQLVGLLLRTPKMVVPFRSQQTPKRGTTKLTRPDSLLLASWFHALSTRARSRPRRPRCTDRRSPARGTRASSLPASKSSWQVRPEVAVLRGPSWQLCRMEPMGRCPFWVWVKIKQILVLHFGHLFLTHSHLVLLEAKGILKSSGRPIFPDFVFDFVCFVGTQYAWETGQIPCCMAQGRGGGG